MRKRQRKCNPDTPDTSCTGQVPDLRCGAGSCKGRVPDKKNCRETFSKSARLAAARRTGINPTKAIAYMTGWTSSCISIA
jgi:hypothetical protein